MPNEELRDQKQRAISSESDDFVAMFAKVLEHEYTGLATQLSASANVTDFRRAMAAAICKTLVDSGMTIDEVAQLMNDAAASLFAGTTELTWSDADNTRRIDLIDKSLQQCITRAESLELAHLTARMRAILDNEQMVPLAGARRLHRLLSSAKESET